MIDIHFIEDEWTLAVITLKFILKSIQNWLRIEYVIADKQFF